MGANLPVLPETDTKDADDAAKGEAIVKKSSSRGVKKPPSLRDRKAVVAETMVDPRRIRHGAALWSPRGADMAQ